MRERSTYRGEWQVTNDQACHESLRRLGCLGRATSGLG